MYRFLNNYQFCVWPYPDGSLVLFYRPVECEACCYIWALKGAEVVKLRRQFDSLRKTHQNSALFAYKVAKLTMQFGKYCECPQALWEERVAVMRGIYNSSNTEISEP